MAEETKEAASSKAAPKKGAKKKAGAKKSTAKRKAEAGTKGTFDGSKTDFIKKYRALTPLEVETKAKDFNLAIKAAYVSSVRSKNKAKGSSGPSGKPARAKAPSKGAEADFRKAARAITLDRAQEILDEIGAAYEG